MDLSALARAVRAFWWLLLLGVAVAALAALLAGFTIRDGRLALRALPVYNAASNILITEPGTSEFQSELPGQVLTDGKSAPVQRNLSSLAVIYAYMASGSQVRTAVEQSVGTLGPDESIIAVQRTTQPSGDEKNPGRYSLPILQIVGRASTPGRATQIAEAADAAFREYAAQKQATDRVPKSAQVGFEELEAPTAELSDDTSNPYIPLIATGAGVLLAFLALTLILYNVRIRRALVRTAVDVEVAEAEDEQEARERSRRQLGSDLAPQS